MSLEPISERLPGGNQEGNHGIIRRAGMSQRRLPGGNQEGNHGPKQRRGANSSRLPGGNQEGNHGALGAWVPICHRLPGGNQEGNHGRHTVNVPLAQRLPGGNQEGNHGLLHLCPRFGKGYPMFPSITSELQVTRWKSGGQPRRTFQPIFEDLRLPGGNQEGNHGHERRNDPSNNRLPGGNQEGNHRRSNAAGHGAWG